MTAPRLPSEIDARDLIDFKTYRDLVFDFEDVLTCNGIRIENGFILERIGLEVVSLEDRRQNPGMNDILTLCSTV